MLALKRHNLDAWFGCDSLLQADQRIHVADISQETTIKTSYTSNMGQAGRRRARIQRKALKITISFTIEETSDIWIREDVVEAANAWARDGFLEISTKLNRRVYVNCTGKASIRQAMDQQEVFQLTFETADSPFWEDKAPTLYALSGTTASAQVSIPGTRESAPADVAITPDSETLNTLTLALGGTQMAFTGLAVAAGETLVLSHDEQTGFLKIMAGSASKYACRTGGSDDELTCAPGMRTVGFTANTACAVAFSMRGRYE